MTMFDLSGKIALVAGGAGYLALPACLGLARQGAAVVIADLNEEALEKAVKEVAAASSEEKVMGIHLDIREESSIKHAVTETLARFGRLEVMVNATYASIGKPLEDLSAAEFDQVNRVNLTGAFLLARQAAEAMNEGGSIIMYASMYGLVSPDPRIYHAPMAPNPIEYGAGKAGIIQMVRYLAVHYGPQAIRVNAIAPGPFPTPKTVQDNPDFAARLAAKTPLGRIGRRDETAGAVVFLAADEASYITGQVLRVDGGWTTW